MGGWVGLMIQVFKKKRKVVVINLEARVMCLHETLRIGSVFLQSKFHLESVWQKESFLLL